ncbi:hypothetical protein KY366_06840 [Candidatus Woesearchaeota archaeon]|nr:hypothetical protein [Candidatus Woesearchaeota archaeon]
MKRFMASKYYDDIYRLLDKEEIQSTNEITRKLQWKFKKAIDWYLVCRVLERLREEGKATKLTTRGGFYWKKK